ncbi:MAG TPA: phosphatidylserine/phosphatidylglycerophosphate/cardiolipin synthase family protein [Solirubrobacteraceae bacterium]|jgi:phosphatidylserine/phosphatidylglycerophosphate/cardiolipin synthase-like enzyme|nr:phosphatidylserine/phosphatidylglycerophosphate/cardiolipin synthase family protein [Solirubrobacteraceae bacterium]
MSFFEHQIAGWVDARAGDGIEALVKLKHRRRLARLHQREALEPGSGWWAAGDPPPRQGCSLEVFVDGADYFAAVAEAIGQARRSIHITGWHLAPYFQIARGREPLVLGEALAEAAERIDVRVLVWAGSPLPLFRPSRSDVEQAVRTLTRGTRIRCKPDPREHPFHCHHEKTMVIDSELAFVGGIDMTDLAGDRYDVSTHPARRELGWHDVSTRLRGPAVADVAAHFNLRWHELTGEDLDRPPELPPAGEQTVQVVRTVAEGMYDEVPRGDFRVLESYLRAIEQAQDFIYLENQFLWSPEIVSRLADKLRRPPQEDFRLVIVLPSKANNGQDDTSGQVAVLESADDGAGRLLVATLRSLTGTRDDRLYVHAKVGIVDDRWLTVGSANLNAHSLLNDTEMNVVTDDRTLARDTRVRLWSEHLQLDPGVVEELAAHEAVDRHWRPVAMEQLRRSQAGQEPTHRLIALPGVSRRSRRLLGPLTGLIDDG